MGAMAHGLWDHGASAAIAAASAAAQAAQQQAIRHLAVNGSHVKRRRDWAISLVQTGQTAPLVRTLLRQANSTARFADTLYFAQTAPTFLSNSAQMTTTSAVRSKASPLCSLSRASRLCASVWPGTSLPGFLAQRSYKVSGPTSHVNYAALHVFFAARARPNPGRNPLPSMKGIAPNDAR